MPLVVTYGPDTVQGRMYDRIGPSEVVGSAIIEGYELVFDKPNMKNKAEGLPNLQPADGAVAFGLLFELTPKQFEMLDGFFGGYERKVLDVKTTDENPITRPARTWLARRTKKGLKASKANVELTKKGLEENEAPQSFIDALKDYEVLE
jgi:hypothetical protein